MKTRNKKKPAVPAGQKVDYTLSASSLAQQLEKAHREIADLHTRLSALKAVHTALTGRNQHLLEDVAAALLLAGQVETAYQSTPTDKAPTAHTPKKLEQPTPGGSTKQARRAVGKLRTELRDAVDEFHHQRDHFWAPPRVQDDIPRVRCRRNDCPALDIRVPAWKTVRGRSIPTERCSSCGEPLTRIDPQEETR